jgi:hypothetical protein
VWNRAPVLFLLLHDFGIRGYFWRIAGPFSFWLCAGTIGVGVALPIVCLAQPWRIDVRQCSLSLPTRSSQGPCPGVVLG